MPARHVDKILTAKLVRELLDYDPSTGYFTWKETRSRLAIKGDEAGTLRVDKSGKKYLMIVISGRGHVANRLAWLHVHGEWPPGRLSAIDGDLSNTRLENLVPEAMHYSDSPMAEYQRRRRAKMAHARRLLEYADRRKHPHLY
jgi:hypothetical protein